MFEAIREARAVMADNLSPQKARILAMLLQAGGGADGLGLDSR